MSKITLNNARQHAHTRIVDALNAEFAKSYGGFQRCVCKVGDGAIIWFPTVFRDRNVMPKTGWSNILSQDGKEIVTEYIGKDVDKKETTASRYTDCIHITFARIHGSDLYKFIGVFSCEKKANKRIYKLISDEIDVVGQKVSW